MNLRFNVFLVGMLLSFMCRATPTITWQAADGTVSTATQALPYNTAATFQTALIITEDTPKGSDLLVIKGGGGTTSINAVYKSFRVTYTTAGDLVFFVAGKNGSSVEIGTLCSAASAGTYAVAWTIPSGGTNLTIKACAIGGNCITKGGFNFDNVAGTSWEANAPFDTWEFSDSVQSLSVLVGTSLSAQEALLQAITTTEACTAAFTVCATLEIAETTPEGDLLVYKGGGGNSTTTDVYKRFCIRYSDAALTFYAAGKDGQLQAFTTAQVASITPGTYHVAWTVRQGTAANGTGLTLATCISGGTVQTKSNYNFDNVAHTEGLWPANAAFNAWDISPAISAITLFTEAKADEDLSTLVNGTQPTSSTLEIGDETITWPTDWTPATIRFTDAEGILTIPANITLSQLTFEADTTAGTIEVAGTLQGVDTTEPALPAFAIPRSITLQLQTGATLEMDGRLSAPVIIAGDAVKLGAATPTRTLTLDEISIAETIELPSVIQGCVEIYETYCLTLAPKTDDANAALRCWKRPGFRLFLK